VFELTQAVRRVIFLSVMAAMFSLVLPCPRPGVGIGCVVTQSKNEDWNI
jgi:hypothetical protein